MEEFEEPHIRTNNQKATEQDLLNAELLKFICTLLKFQ